MLEQGYIELLGILDPAQFTNNLDKFLAEREGLLGSPSTAATTTRRRGGSRPAASRPMGPRI